MQRRRMSYPHVGVRRWLVEMPRSKMPRSKMPRSGAIDHLRTVEFRQTLRGYHIDDVDEYLERVAVEVEALKDRLDQRSRYPGSHPIPVAGTDPPRAGSPNIRPRTGWAIVTCMDTRVDVYKIFGLRPGDAHVIRNAGGVVTDDTIRSLTISQRVGGTDSILLVHHTDCALSTITDDGFARSLAMEAGVEPPWVAGAIADVETDVLRCIGRLEASPFLVNKEAIRGFVYEVMTGELSEIDSSADAMRASELATDAPMWSGWW
jgi:carbonic anhydrase